MASSISGIILFALIHYIDDYVSFNPVGFIKSLAILHTFYIF